MMNSENATRRPALKSLNPSLKTLSLTRMMKIIGKMIYPLAKIVISIRLSQIIVLSQKTSSMRRKYNMTKSDVFAL